MAKKVLMTFAGMVIGLVCGVLTGGILDLITGAGIGLLGVRTRYGLEWLFFMIVIIPIGIFLFDYSRNWNAWSELLELTGIGSLAGWLSALVVKAALGKWFLENHSSIGWMAFGSFVLFAALMFRVPRFLLIVVLTISP